MHTIFVGVGEFAVSKDPEAIIRTMALGSCVAVVILDPVNKSVGLLHVALPDSSINSRRVLEKPGMFADTGIPLLIDSMMSLGNNGNRDLSVKLIGGASIMDPNITFNIGKRNVLAIRKVLWLNKLGAIAEDVGGFISRTVSIEVMTGKMVISSPGRGRWEL